MKRQMKAALVVWGLASVGIGLVASALAQPPDARSPGEAPIEAEAAQRDREEMALRLGRALSRRLTVWTSPGGRVDYVSHCRNAVRGCPARVAAIARYMAEVSDEQGLDPFVLAAIAVRESGLNPFVEGAVGEWGIVQLHPHGIGRGVRFVRNEAYRNRCRRIPGACQREVLEVGATHLAQGIALCGSLSEALGAYNRGECGETAYTRRVMREHARLLDLIKTEPVTPTDG